MANEDVSKLDNFHETWLSRQRKNSEFCCKVCSRRRFLMAGFGTLTLVLTIALIVGPTAASGLTRSSGTRNTVNSSFKAAAFSLRRFILAVTFIAGSTAASLNSRSRDVEIPLKVAAFNIRRFGRSKMSKPEAVNTIVNILNRYDLVLVQEVRDSTGEALRNLWSRLNQTDIWDMIDSVAVGRRSYKEQYVFFYKPARARHIESFLLTDSADVYERDPFAAEFEYFSTSAREFVRVAFLALHSRPADAYEELVQLGHDIPAVAEHFTEAAGVISMGDFNADCRYVSRTRLSRLKIFNNARFTSLIPHSADTTAGSTNCAYDRVIVYGRGIQARAARVFDFQTEYGLSDAATVDVSDHYPVEFKLF